MFSQRATRDARRTKGSVPSHAATPILNATLPDGGCLHSVVGSAARARSPRPSEEDAHKSFSRETRTATDWIVRDGEGSACVRDSSYPYEECGTKRRRTSSITPRSVRLTTRSPGRRNRSSSRTPRRERPRPPLPLPPLLPTVVATSPRARPSRASRTSPRPRPREPPHPDPGSRRRRTPLGPRAPRVRPCGIAHPRSPPGASRGVGARRLRRRHVRTPPGTVRSRTVGAALLRGYRRARFPIGLPIGLPIGRRRRRVRFPRGRRSRRSARTRPRRTRERGGDFGGGAE